MKSGFALIRLEDYVEQHLRSNPGVERGDLYHRLKHALEAARRGVRCRCGAPIWIIGSAEVGLDCFTCITGDATPDNDYEMDLRPAGKSSRPEHPKPHPGKNPSHPPGAKPTPLQPGYRFEPGSFGQSGTWSLPSIQCFEQVAPGKWEAYFCLVNPRKRLPGAGEASDQAKADLNEAFAVKKLGGSDWEVAKLLRQKGYLQLEELPEESQAAEDPMMPF